MKALLAKHRILICAGTGGVGKTTLSASLGVLAAREGLRTLVMTIDPAQRLAQALGTDQAPGEAVPVPGRERLSAVMIDPRKEFDEFVLGAVDNVVAKGLFDNRLYQQLVGNLNGSQEFTSLLRLHQAVQSGLYDLVILDTPPTQNAVDFLAAPDRIYALFQDSVIGWFANPDRDESWLKRALHRGTRLVTSALESVTGSTFIAELKDFFNHIARLKDRIARVSTETQALLHAPTTAFVLVTGFDEAKLKEALEFQHDLKVANLNLMGVVVNRWFPEWAESHQGWPEDWASDPDFVILRDFYQKFSQYFSSRQEAFDGFVNQLGRSVPVTKLPDFSRAVQGIDELDHVADTLKKRWGGQS